MIPYNLNESTLSEITVKISLWLLAIVAPLYDVLGAVLLLILIDFATGVGAAFRNKERISSRKMKNTVNKFLFYGLTIIAAYVVESKITPRIPFLNIVSGFIALTELRSVFENFNIIFGLNIWEYVKAIINRTKTGAEIIDDLKKINNEKK